MTVPSDYPTRGVLRYVCGAPRYELTVPCATDYQLPLRYIFLKSFAHPLPFMEFLRGKDGLDSSKTDYVKSYMMSGTWATTTLKHYNAGVTKLMEYALERHVHRSRLLPIEPDVLYDFVTWASPPLFPSDSLQGSPPIKSTTVRTYLSGIKAWHLLHDQKYPHEATPRVECILTAAAKLELQKAPKTPKNPVLVKHLFMLLESLSGGSLEQQVAYTVALAAFWGMARLGELLKSSVKVNQVKVKDVIWHPLNKYLIIRIREAKTATVGEVQEIHCQRQDSLLDPVGAIQRLITSSGATEDDNLFSYPCNGKRVTLSKARCMRLFDDVWKSKAGQKLTGHSFRVGGALLRWNLEIPIEEIVAVGRWKSKAYKLYIREFNNDELSSTVKLLDDLKYS